MIPRRAVAGDEEAMAALEARATPWSWSSQQYLDSIVAHQCLVLEADGGLVGLLVYNLVLDEAELLNVAVDPQWQGRGLGRVLMGTLLDDNAGRASRIFLEVRESNLAAIALYRHCGFVQVAVRKNYYPSQRGRENALVMRYDYD